MALQQTAECWVREVCQHCAGKGHVGHVRAYCNRCQATWTAAKLASHLDSHFGGWWGYHVALLGDWLWQLFCRLPCGHKLKHLRYTDPTCPTCHGEKFTFRWVTLREVRRELLASLRPHTLHTGAGGYPSRFPGFPIIPPMRL